MIYELMSFPHFSQTKEEVKECVAELIMSFCKLSKSHSHCFSSPEAKLDKGYAENHISVAHLLELVVHVCLLPSCFDVVLIHLLDFIFFSS